MKSFTDTGFDLHGSPPLVPLFSLRLAREEDAPALEALISLSVHGLQATHYSSAQREAALGPVFGVDRQLIRDGTYFVVIDREGGMAACGGWSRRRAVFGGDGGRCEEDPALDPACEPARIRAFFVRPDRARCGLGRTLLHACESALCDAGFHAATLVATLAGEEFYAACGYTVAERYEVGLPGGLTLPVVRMTKSCRAAAGRPRENSSARHV